MNQQFAAMAGAMAAIQAQNTAQYDQMYNQQLSTMFDNNYHTKLDVFCSNFTKSEDLFWFSDIKFLF